MKIRQNFEFLRANSAFSTVEKVAGTLIRSGYPTYLAGGSVRDALLGHVPHDFDLATAAEPDVVERTFSRTHAVGKKFGTILVLEDRFQFEVTTFRREGPYRNGRHPDFIEFATLEEDAARRDFTVNALYFDFENQKILDFVGGVNDLDLKILRAVGEPALRFKEDALRLMRAVRFVSQLGFELESQTRSAILENQKLLKSVSAERLQAELIRLLEAKFLSSGLRDFEQLGLARQIFPEIDGLDIKFFEFSRLFENFEGVLDQLAKISGFNFGERLTALKFSRAVIDRHLRVFLGMRAWQAVPTPLEQIKIVGSPEAARIGALGGARTPTWLETLTMLQDRGGGLGRLPDALISGRDLIEAGIQPGARMGELLKIAFDAQLLGFIRNQREAKEYLAKRQLAFF